MVAVVVVVVAAMMLMAKHPEARPVSPMMAMAPTTMVTVPPRMPVAVAYLNDQVFTSIAACANGLSDSAWADVRRSRAERCDKTRKQAADNR